MLVPIVRRPAVVDGLRPDVSAVARRRVRGLGHWYREVGAFPRRDTPVELFLEIAMVVVRRRAEASANNVPVLLLCRDLCSFVQLWLDGLAAALYALSAAVAERRQSKKHR